MIDIDKLEKAAGGDPAVKVSVSKKWLEEVAKELRDLERLRKQQSSRKEISDALDKIWGKR